MRTGREGWGCAAKRREGSQETFSLEREGQLVGVCRDGTRATGFKLKAGIFRLDIGKESFPLRGVRH